MATNTAVDVVMPQMGVSVSEGTITKWLKQQGETIAADEPLLEISTDKVDTEVPSPGSGVVSQILVQEGETVEVGTKLAVITPEGAEAPPSDERPPDAVPEPATAEAAAASSAVSDAPAQAPSADTVAEAEPVRDQQPQEAPAAPSEDGKSFVSPVVARIASEHGVDPNQVQGTGRGGRVTKKDILNFIEMGGRPAAAEQPEAPPPAAPQPVAAAAAPADTAAPAETATPADTAAPAETAAPADTAAAAEAAPAEAPAPATPAEAPRREAPAPPGPPKPEAPAPVAEIGKPGVGEAFEPMTAMRRGIAEHMRRSLDTSAHVTTVFEVDLTNVVQLRQKLKGEYQTSYGVNLTYLAFIARATIEAIRNWPWINGEIRGDKIVTKSFINLGIAVALEGGKGLIVPVVKNAEEKNLLGLARAIVDVADRARSKKLTPDDVQGGTFTITNPGGWGAIMGTPIISQPQVGILDVEALVRRPVVITDDAGAEAIAIRSMMNLCLSYDHRLVDGAYAAQFMKELRENLETWDESAY
jgi:pyruvate dehydrogenase E2 component (dihydrolipoamide acetyltransferase)